MLRSLFFGKRLQTACCTCASTCSIRGLEANPAESSSSCGAAPIGVPQPLQELSSETQAHLRDAGHHLGCGGRLAQISRMQGGDRLKDHPACRARGLASSFRRGWTHTNKECMRKTKRQLC